MIIIYDCFYELLIAVIPNQRNIQFIHSLQDWQIHYYLYYVCILFLFQWADWVWTLINANTAWIWSQTVKSNHFLMSMSRVYDYLFIVQYYLIVSYGNARKYCIMFYVRSFILDNYYVFFFIQFIHICSCAKVLRNAWTGRNPFQLTRRIQWEEKKITQRWTSSWLLLNTFFYHTLSSVFGYLQNS